MAADTYSPNTRLEKIMEHHRHYFGGVHVLCAPASAVKTVATAQATIRARDAARRAETGRVATRPGRDTVTGQLHIAC